MGGFRDTAIRDNDPRTEVANLRVEVGVLREEVARLRAIEAAAREVLSAWDRWIELPGGALGATVERMREVFGDSDSQVATTS